MEKINIIESKPISLLVDNINTDIIIPKQFLKIIDKKGLGQHAFSDWRQDPDFVLNQEELNDATILVAGDNFGIGSSREHAVWSLLDWGINSIIAGSYSDIFYNNSIKNGLLPIKIGDTKIRKNIASSRFVRINLEKQLIECFDQDLETPSFTYDFEIESRPKEQLLKGLDEIDYTLTFLDQIEQFEAKL